jgi:ribosome maturation factor RimP
VEGTDVPFVIGRNKIMIDKVSVNQLIGEYVHEKELFLVDLNISPDNRIRIEIDSFAGISIDDCADLTQFIHSKLDRDEEDYELEVSSAGIGSPFKIHQQYLKHVGREVDVVTAQGRKLNGVLKSVTEEGIQLTTTQMVKPEGAKRKTTVHEDVYLTFKDIKTTKLIIRFK